MGKSIFQLLEDLAAVYTKIRTPSHLSKWLAFVQTNADNQAQIGHDSGIVADERSMHSVARWGYANAMSSGGQAWLKSNAYEPVNEAYVDCLG